MFKKIIKIIPFVLFLTAFIIAIYNLMQKESNDGLIIAVFVLNIVAYILYYFAYNKD